MSRWLALTVALAALGGCLSSSGSEDPLAGVKPGLQEAYETGLEDVDRILGLTVDADHKTLTYDMLAAMDRDSVQFLAVQALQDIEYRYSDDANIIFESPPSTSEQRDVNSACLFEVNWSGAPGDYFLARATGHDDARPPENTTFGGTAGYSFASGGSSSGSRGSGNGRLDRGEWFLFIGGMAGADAGVARDAGSTWQVGFEASAPVRIVKLQPALYSCGFGFRDLPGAAVTPDPAAVYQDGTLTIDGTYGGTFGLCPGLDAMLVNPLGPVYNKASIDFMGNVTQLSPVLATHLEDPRHAPMTLQVDEWMGDPLWAMVGLWMPQVGMWFPC